MGAERYDRQQRIQGWDQKALAQARVLIVDAGALGNELLKNLSLCGVGHIGVVDFDRIELSNLSRTVLFRDEDIGRPKAQVAAEAATRLNCNVDIRHIDGDVFYDVGLGFYRHVNLTIGGLDNLAARSQVGLSCALAGIPFLDGGMWALGGEVRWFLPDNGPCFECTLTDDDRQRAYERRSCTGLRSEGIASFDQRVPTTVSTAAVIGGILAQEAVRYLCGWRIQSGEAIVYNGLALAMHRAALSRNPDCPYHLPYQNVVELDRTSNTTTGHELLNLAAADLGRPIVLGLGRDFLLGFFCPSCERYEEINMLIGKVEETRAICPHCGTSRKAKILSQLDGSEDSASRTLQELGIPPGEVLSVRAGEHLRLYELTDDVERFWA